jgi:acetyl esterase
MEKAGVQVRYKNYEGVTHEFFGMGAVVDKAKEAEQFAAEGLKSAFAK